MIPKIIHYIWLGGKEKPELVQRCIASWHRFMPDWQYMEWNEDTIDAYCKEHNIPSPISNLPYCREAYDARKFAFVSDYIRLWALEKFGGVYMDTDVEVIKPLDDLLEQKAFIGFEESLAHLPGTCVIGTEAHGEWIISMLKVYNDIHFVDANGVLDMTTNVVRLGTVMIAQGLIPNGEEQVLSLPSNETIHIYPFDYFSPLTSTRVLRVSARTYTIHHFAMSWKEQKGWTKCWNFICDKIVGREMINRLVLLKRKLCYAL